eukprot:gene25188-33711_t
MVNPKTHQLPLNDILENSEIALPPPEVISALIAAYNDAVNIYSEAGCLSVHYAAQRHDVAILKLIDEANSGGVAKCGQPPLYPTKNAGAADSPK